MLIYNVTVNIEDEVHDEWLNWMKTVHIPAVLRSNCFSHHYFTKLISRQDDETGVTYAIQYHCKSENDFATYQRDYAPDLQAEHSKKYEGKFVAFRSILEKV
jgi:hypothetical protein